MRMNRSRIAAFSLALAVVGTVGACSSNSSSSSSSSSTNGNKATFCKDNADLDAATANISDPQQLGPIFKANASKIDELVKTAPPEVKADTDLLANAAKKVAASGDPSPFIGDQNLQAAGKHLDTFCGVSSASSSSGAGGSTSSTDSTSSTEPTIKSEDSTSSSESSST